MTHYYRPANWGDCRELAPFLRKQDEKEVMASDGLSPLRALQESFKASYGECHTIIHEDGSIVGMFGLAVNGMFASPWLLGSDKLPETKKVMLPVSAKWVEEMNTSHPLLLNFVHAENTVSIKWLKSLGFQFINLVKEYGVGREPFYQFVRIKENV
jgi:hypothetical protein